MGSRFEVREHQSVEEDVPRRQAGELQMVLPVSRRITSVREVIHGKKAVNHVYDVLKAVHELEKGAEESPDIRGGQS